MRARLMPIPDGLSVPGLGRFRFAPGGRLAVWIGGPWVLGSIGRAEDDTWSEEARANVGVAAMPTG